VLHGALATFSESASLADARALAPSAETFLSDLEALVGWSLVRSEASDGAVRLSMLETVREHALGHLRESGALDELRERHADRFLQLALDAESELAGATPAAWFDRLEVEFDNIASALDWLLSVGRVDDGLRAISALERFWRGHAHVTEARRWLAHALALATDTPRDVRAGALRTASLLAAAQSDWAGAMSSLTEARALYRALGDGREEVFALSYLSFYATRLSDNAAAEQFAEDAVEVAAALDDDRVSSAAISALADVYSANGEHDQALPRYEEVVALRTRLGDPLLLTDAVYALGKEAFHAGEDARARQELGRALERARQLGEEQYTAAAQLLLSLVDARAGDPASAADRAREALELYTHLEDDRSRARCVVVVAAASAEQGDLERAARLTGAAEALRGDGPPDEFETPLLERYLPGLEASFGTEALAALIVQGRMLGIRSLEPVVVSAEIEA
jgi:non-specific serine/threonine protein kinase